MNTPDLFTPIRLGAIEASNRIIMAPLTRMRAGPDRVPTPLMAEYYAQRAAAGLIVSEAVAISQQGTGCPNSPGIYTDEQIAGWQKVTEAVHQAGGRIFLQLWHMGRISHPSFQPDGGFLRQFQQQLERLVRDAVLRVIQKKSGGLNGHTLATLGIGGEQFTQVQILNLLVMRGESLPSRTLGEWFDGVFHGCDSFGFLLAPGAVALNL
jgi:hypothetical protein